LSVPLSKLDSSSLYESSLLLEHGFDLGFFFVFFFEALKVASLLDAFSYSVLISYAISIPYNLSMLN
jgi:hypothetical protein